ncbi:MAG: AMP-binding protein [Flavobacteriales bacterium]
MKWFGENIDVPEVWHSMPKEVQQVVLEWRNAHSHIQAKTSGSTGTPKVIQLDKTEVKASAILTAATFGIEQGATILHNLPVEFIAGKVMLIRALVNDWNVIYAEPTVNVPLPEVSIDFAAFTPLQLNALFQNQQTRLNRISTMIIGGGEVSVDLKKQIQALSGRVFATYGMTETITHIAWSDLKEESLHTWFRPIEGVSISLSPESTLMIQALHLGNKIIQTNDLAEIDAFGRFRILGRIDFIINSGGLKVNPAVLEGELQTILAQPFFVGAKTDVILGQKVVLFVEGEMSKALKEKVLFLFGDRVDRPREICEIHKFDYTTTGKLIRKEY